MLTISSVSAVASSVSVAVRLSEIAEQVRQREALEMLIKR
jgi:hypothetical protein